MTNKKVYLEILRVIAIIGVLFIHLPGYRLYPAYSGIMQVIYLSFTNLSQICIPMFFMISGALLLKKDEDYGTVFKKRILRFVVLIFVFEGLYYLLSGVYEYATSGTLSLSLKKYILGVFEYDIEGLESYWYLYSYLCFLFMLPFFQRIAKGMKKADFWVLFIIHTVLITFIPIMKMVAYGTDLQNFYITSDFNMTLFMVEPFVYPLMGYYIDNVFDIKRLEKKQRALLGLAFVASLAMVDIYTIQQGKLTGEYSADNIYMTNYIFAIIVFLLVKYYCEVKKEGNSIGFIIRFFCLGGSLTFGIYLLDPFLKLLFYDSFQETLAAHMPYIIITFLWILISMTVCGFVTFLLKKLPGFKKLL